jgi:DNA-directed RNA polymerase specialized sigma24 family protein
MASSSSGSGPYDRFLSWLSPDFEQALKEEKLIRKRLTRYFALKGCPEVDRDRLTGETIDTVLKIEDRWNQYKDPLALCVGVARNVWRQYLRQPKTEPIMIDPPIPVPDPDHEEQLQCLEKCLAELPEDERQLLTQYFHGEGRERIETRRRLAEEQGGSGNLRLTVFRIKAKVRARMFDCLGMIKN